MSLIFSVGRLRDGMTEVSENSGRSQVKVKESRTDGAVRALREWIFARGLRSGELLPSES